VTTYEIHHYEQFINGASNRGMVTDVEDGGGMLTALSVVVAMITEGKAGRFEIIEKKDGHFMIIMATIQWPLAYSEGQMPRKSGQEPA
jgi:hypothetical protein